MARSRNIKPGLFVNDTLAELPVAARYLFAGLWVIADREGRLEDRPRKIKAQILPYDDEDVDTLLQGLHEKGFILRYSVDGCQYISVLKWHKHQNPHVNEAPSSIPAPPDYSTSTVQAPEDSSSNPADSLNLDPGSLDPGFSASSAEAPKKPTKETTEKAKRPLLTLEEVIATYGEDGPHRTLKEIEIDYGDLIPYYPTQLGHVTQLLKRFKWHEIVDCWKFKKKQKNGCWVDLVIVGKEITDWKAGRLPGQKGQPNGRTNPRQERALPLVDGDNTEYYQSNRELQRNQEEYRRKHGIATPAGDVSDLPF